MERIRLLIVDDHLIVRRGLSAICAAEPDLGVAGAAGSGDEALALALHHPFDVALIDVRMPGMGGIELCRRLRQEVPAVAAILLSETATEEMVREALQAGARGYLLKDVDEVDLVRAIRSVARGEAAIAPKAAAVLVHLLSQSPDGPGVSDEDLELLRCIARGLTNRAMASMLYMSENTVKDRVVELFRKLHVKGRVEAVMEGVRRGLL
jgi:DNA-binding NarL/FixJ family response regulator